MMKNIVSLGVWVACAGSAAAADVNGKAASLPLREVILYSSGVGYFERSGQVEGARKLELNFRTEDINDLLKSMVVQDSSGRIGAITYDSRDPISKTLHSFAIDLTANPNMRDLLNQMRGESVEVSWPNSTTGIVLGVESREVEVSKETKRQEDFLNLFSGGSFQSIPLSQIKQIKLKNERLQKELDEALLVLAKGHDTEKKTVTLSFEGEGKRDVNVAYIVEAPVWKTSYRLVLDENEGGGFLQGWAIVENTGDDDWNDIRLSLVSGRPISFKMDLYQPLYAQRPTVQPELYLSLRPQVYEEGEVMVARDELRNRTPVPSAPAAAAPMLRAAQSKAETAGKLIRGFNVQGVGGGTGGFTDAMGLSLDAIQSAAEGAVAGELFQYTLQSPVSIQRQKSAMLPIVTERMKGSKLSIYNQNVQAKHPLNGFRLKNSSDLHLMQGPITVFDGGSYAGDARIEDMAPGQERLISYGIDLKTEVEPQIKGEPETLVSVRIARGAFVATKKGVEQKTYIVRNKDKKKKTVLIEHPFRGDWTLEEPKKASERARDFYRFAVELDGGKSDTLSVRESKQYQEEVLISNMPVDTFSFYLRSSKVSEKVKEVLRKVVVQREQIAQLAADRKLREDRLQEIGQEQARIRENMARLSQNSELYQRYVKKFDEQESEFERLRGETAKLKETEAQRQRELNEYLAKLELD